ncbi:hypothetical protein STSP2_01002 [Anaerohalosphaera lusitana]|uniref:Uncharacterized protein n=1 Tax=Anaerohalosphaera lusitana TaxID=1936003 RepID=A0A1U9NJT7_9BACT|nr:hypothetical protein [Anaerohalosphaera lusitana]AQT67850.1 hypothetical protein STSP2_01002 [Anaerohalosphaera lusitana]
MSGKVKFRVAVIAAVLCFAGFWGGAGFAVEAVEEAGSRTQDERADAVVGTGLEGVEFVEVEKPYTVGKDSVMDRGPIEPQFMARFHLKYSLGIIEDEFEDKAGEMPSGERFSDEQKKYLKYCDATSSTTGFRPRIEGYRQWRLYAVSERDVKLMVRAFFEYLDYLRRGQIDSLKEQKEGLSGEIERLEGDKKQKQEELSVLEGQLEEVKAESIYTESDEAGQAVGRLTSRMEELKLKIAGLEAKGLAAARAVATFTGMIEEERYADIKTELLKAVVEYEKKKADVQGELSAASGEYRLAEEMRKAASEFARLPGRMDRLQHSIRAFDSELKDERERLERTERSLKRAVEGDGKPQVYDDKIEVFSVEISARHGTGM